MKNETATNLLTPQQAAERIGVKVSTLAVWRCTQRYALPFIKIGGGKYGSVRYRPEDVEAFIQSFRQVPITA